MEKVSIRVLIVDDNRIVREGIAVLLEGTGVQVIGCVPDGDYAAQAVCELRPDLVLAVASKPGITLARALTRSSPDVKVVILGVSELAAEVIEVVEAGAAGYVLNDASLDEFSDTLRAIVGGEAPCPPKVVASVFSRLAKLAGERKKNGSPSGPTRLTRREVQVLGLVAEGVTNKEIAARLQVEVQTVKNHVHNILEKLEVHDRLLAAKRAMDIGLFSKQGSSPPVELPRGVR